MNNGVSMSLTGSAAVPGRSELCILLAAVARSRNVRNLSAFPHSESNKAVLPYRKWKRCLLSVGFVVGPGCDVGEFQSV